MLRKKIILLCLVSIVIFGLCGCILKPYKVEVQQGNIIGKETISKLQVGMQKDDVRSIMGEPVLKDTFDEDSWLYVFTQQKRSEKMVVERIELKFKDDILVDIKKS